MAFSINDILQTIEEAGSLQTNKFEVNFVSPPIMQNVTVSGPSSMINSNDVESMIRFRADSAKIPGVLLETSDTHRYGVGSRQKMPFNAMFTDINITMISDKNGDLYRYFYTWFNSIFDFCGEVNGGGFRFPQYATAYKDDYSTDLRIIVYNNDGAKVQSIALREAFPLSFNEISLGWAQQNELMKLNITFAFREWSLEDVTNSNPFTQQTVVSSGNYSAAAPYVTQQTPSVAPVAPDPTQNFLNSKGNFNSPTNADGTATPTFSWF
jgi:hypothetical protein